MRRTLLSLLVVPAITAVVLLASPDPVRAAAPGHGGGFHSGGYSRGGISHGGYSGGYHSSPHYNYGYRNSGYHYRPFFYGYPYYGSSFYYPYYSSGYYPYYGYSSSYTPYYDGYPSYSVDPGVVTTDSGTTIAPMNLPATPENNSANGQQATSNGADATDNTAKVAVHVPNTDANVWIDGTMMNGTGTDREFVTPTLVPGQKYVYEIHVRWLEGDVTHDQTKKVMFSPGDKVDVNFPPAAKKELSAP